MQAIRCIYDVKLRCSQDFRFQKSVFGFGFCENLNSDFGYVRSVYLLAGKGPPQLRYTEHFEFGLQLCLPGSALAEAGPLWLR